MPRNRTLPSSVGSRTTGTVKRWDDAKGFGFVRVDRTDEDCFVHHSAIQQAIGGRKSLAEGQRVELDVQAGDKGLRAANVVVFG